MLRVVEDDSNLTFFLPSRARSSRVPLSILSDYSSSRFPGPVLLAFCRVEDARRREINFKNLRDHECNGQAKYLTLQRSENFPRKHKVSLMHVMLRAAIYPLRRATFRDTSRRNGKIFINQLKSA
jgi:hypothetical protein